MSGEEVDVNDWLIEAAGEDEIERARNYKNDDGETFFNSSKPLHLAAEGCFFNICKFLIEQRGVHVNTPNWDFKTPLCFVCRSYDKFEKENAKKIVKLLLSKNANFSLHLDEKAPLHHVAESGWKKAVSILLEAGVDVNIRSGNDSTPLHYASGWGQNDVVEILCQNGANVNARDANGWSPLHKIVLYPGWEPVEIIETLLKFGANINAQGAHMETALHCIFPKTDLNIATVLLDNGCDVNIETSRGKVALDTIIAGAKHRGLFYGDEEMISILSETYDNDGTNDDDFEPDALQSVQILKQHLVKLKTAKLFVSQKNLSHLVHSNFSDFEKQCQEEISAAKNEELHLGVTLFDILSAGVDPTYAKNKPVMEALNHCKWDSFPLYKCIILNNIKKSKFRHDLLESGEKWLGILLRTSSVLNEFSVPAEIMSVEILSLIVSFLSNEELEALITCGNELQHQLVDSFSDNGSSTP